MIINSFDTAKEILIIAEIGNNHEGSYTLAEELIGLAAKAGAQAVKFQTIVPDKLVSVKQKERVRQLKEFSLTYHQFKKLHKVAQQEKVIFLSTPFDIESAQFLNSLVPAFKIASGDNNFFPLIDFIARTAKPVILSSGLADLQQINKTKNFIQGIWRKEGITQELAILHCVANYPTAYADASLLFIRQLQKLGVTVGYSDHTIGIRAAVLAVALGARILEKHFTIAKDYSDFHDHRISADPREFAQLVGGVKDTLAMLGNGGKGILHSEKEMVGKLRRSVAAKRDLDKGKAVTWDDLVWVRPGGGLRPGSEKRILGRKLMRKIRRGEMILPADLSKKS